MADCKRCEGSGEVVVEGTSLDRMKGLHVPDPQEERSYRCPACGGAGVLEVSERRAA